MKNFFKKTKTAFGSEANIEDTELFVDNYFGPDDCGLVDEKPKKKFIKKNPKVNNEKNGKTEKPTLPTPKDKNKPKISQKDNTTDESKESVGNEGNNQNNNKKIISMDLDEKLKKQPENKKENQERGSQKRVRTGSKKVAVQPKKSNIDTFFKEMFTLMSNNNIEIENLEEKVKNVLTDEVELKNEKINKTDPLYIVHLEEKMLKTQQKLDKIQKYVKNVLNHHQVHTGFGWVRQGKKKGPVYKWDWVYVKCNRELLKINYYKDSQSNGVVKTVKLPIFFKLVVNTKFKYGWRIETTDTDFEFISSSGQEKNRWVKYWEKSLFKGFKKGIREGWILLRARNAKFGTLYHRYLRIDLNRKIMKVFFSDCNDDCIHTVDINDHLCFVEEKENKKDFQLVPGKEANVKAKTWYFQVKIEKKREGWLNFFRENDYVEESLRFVNKI